MSIIESALAWRITPEFSLEFNRTDTSDARYSAIEYPIPPLPRVGQADIFEVLEKEHKILKDILSLCARSNEGELERERLLLEAKQLIILHELFEGKFFYPLLQRRSPAQNESISLACDQHTHIQELLQQVSRLSIEEGRRLLDDLAITVDEHIRHEEDNIIRNGRSIIDDQDARMLGRQYDQIKEITLFTSSLVDDVMSTLHVSVARSLTLTIDNISPTPMISNGAVDLSLHLSNHIITHTSLLGPLIAGVMQPLARHGYDASLALHFGNRVHLVFVSCPNPDELFVQNMFDPACPRGADSLRDARKARVQDLHEILKVSLSTRGPLPPFLAPTERPDTPLLKEVNRPTTNKPTENEMHRPDYPLSLYISLGFGMALLVLGAVSLLLEPTLMSCAIGLLGSAIAYLVIEKGEQIYALRHS